MKIKILLQIAALMSGISLAACKDTAAESDTDAQTPVANLPATVKPFVDKNYPGYSISTATYDPLCSGDSAYDVSIKKSGAVDLSLVFRPDGAYVQKEEDVALSSAPDSMRIALTAKYTGFTIGDPIEKLTLADNSTQYLFDLTKGSTAKEVQVAANGAVVCEH